MAFLDAVWDKEQHQIAEAKRKADTTREKCKNHSDDTNTKVPINTESSSQSTTSSTDKKQKVQTAIYTIVATEDCTVWRWSFDDMEKLMSNSVDMRGALTRAMTNAVVGKVVNMTFSRAKIPQWTAWLGDWTRDDGAKVELNRIQTLPDEDDNNGSKNKKMPEEEEGIAGNCT
jgi:hypothetical protein